MDSTDVGDIQSIHTLINNETLIKRHHKEEICTCLKNTKLNFRESSNILQQIKSQYETVDRLDIIRNLSIDFGEIENIDITNILGLLRVFGQCIEWDAFDSIIEIIESAFSRVKQQNNKKFNVLKAVCSYNYKFDPIYDIFNKIANENDAETMSFVINEKLHKTKNNYDLDIFSYSLEKSNFNLIHFMIECGIDYTQQLLALNRILNIENATYFFKIPQLGINQRNEFNKTALIIASEKGHHEVVKLLLTVPGIDVDAKDRDNFTALICASAGGHHEVVKLLLTVPGINVNAKDYGNNTALIWASLRGRHKVVKLLLTVPGIDVNAKNW